MVKFGLEVHGVCDTFPEQFAFLAKAVIKDGGEVHIVTGLKEDSDEARDLVKKHFIPYTHYFSIVDYLESIGEEIEWVDGLPYADKQKWDEAKAIYCEEQGIHFMIDDSPVYRDTFNTIPTTYLQLINPKRKEFNVRKENG